MLDLNHGSGATATGQKPERAILDLIDRALVLRGADEPPRNYLGGSRLGVACLRALQFEYTDTPVDPDRKLEGRTYRIFERGHMFEDMAARWLRLAGFDLRTVDSEGNQFGFSTAEGRIAGHIDGVIVGMVDPAQPCPIQVPALWENKAINNKSWNDTVRKGVAVSKPVYAGQIATYQAYMNLADAPALFTAINADTMEIHLEMVPFDGALAQRMTDRGVQVITACEAAELLPRIAQTRDFFECRWCNWADRCWNLP